MEVRALNSENLLLGIYCVEQCGQRSEVASSHEDKGSLLGLLIKRGDASDWRSAHHQETNRKRLKRKLIRFWSDGLKDFVVLPAPLNGYRAELVFTCGFKGHQENRNHRSSHSREKEENVKKMQNDKNNKMLKVKTGSYILKVK